MTSSVLYDNKRKRTTVVTFPQPQEPEAYITPNADLHVAHELVAIAQGPDYCLCGNTWPCEKRPSQGAPHLTS